MRTGHRSQKGHSCNEEQRQNAAPHPFGDGLHDFFVASFWITSGDGTIRPFVVRVARSAVLSSLIPIEAPIAMRSL